VGRSDDRAVRWANKRIEVLGTLIPAHSGWTLASASAINRAGWIVGNGVKDGYPAMFLLIPNTSGKS